MVDEGRICDVSAKTEKERGRREALVPSSILPAPGVQCKLSIILTEYSLHNFTFNIRM